jgi:hypothetical protein
MAKITIVAACSNFRNFYSFLFAAIIGVYLQTLYPKISHSPLFLSIKMLICKIDFAGVAPTTEVGDPCAPSGIPEEGEVSESKGYPPPFLTMVSGNIYIFS